MIEADFCIIPLLSHLHLQCQLVQRQKKSLFLVTITGCGSETRYLGRGDGQLLARAGFAKEDSSGVLFPDRIFARPFHPSLLAPPGLPRPVQDSSCARESGTIPCRLGAGGWSWDPKTCRFAAKDGNPKGSPPHDDDPLLSGLTMMTTRRPPPRFHPQGTFTFDTAN